MTSYRNITSAREDIQVNVKLKLAAAWTSLMFLIIYEVVLLLLIIRYAWKWPQVDA